MAKTEERKELSIDEKFQLLLEVLAAKKSEGIDADTLRNILSETQKATATAIQKAARPENQDHPGISVFSYPEGDKARPKVTLPFEFYYNNYPCHQFPETEHWREMELMAQIKPGEYTALRKDGSKMNVSVTAERDADGNPTKVWVNFPVGRDDKPHIPPKAVVLYQLVYSDNPRKRFVEAMTEHLGMVFGPASETATV